MVCKVTSNTNHSVILSPVFPSPSPPRILPPSLERGAVDVTHSDALCVCTNLLCIWDLTQGERGAGLTPVANLQAASNSFPFLIFF